MDIARLVAALVSVLVDAREQLDLAIPIQPAQRFAERLDEDLQSNAAVLVLAVQELLAVATRQEEDEVWPEIAAACARVLLNEVHEYEAEHGMV